MKVHHAKLKGHDDIIIVHPNWLTTNIFAHIFAPHDFKEDYYGLEEKQEYSVDDLEHHFNVDVKLLLQLLEYFELAYRYTVTVTCLHNHLL